jgi:hypothetical protein
MATVRSRSVHVFCSVADPNDFYLDSDQKICDRENRWFLSFKTLMCHAKQHYIIKISFLDTKPYFYLDTDTELAKTFYSFHLDSKADSDLQHRGSEGRQVQRRYD